MTSLKSVFGAIALLASAGAEAQAPTAFCGALDALFREAVRTGLAQEPFVGQDEPFTFACGHRRGSEVQRAFCSAAQDEVGLEFVHAFPWKVYDCLRARGVDPDIRTSEHYTGLQGRGRLTRLAATWRRARIEIRYTPFADDLPADDEFAGYRGRYDVAVARAD